MFLAVLSVTGVLAYGADVAGATTGTELGGMNLSAYCQQLEAGNKGATLSGETWVCIHANNTTATLNLQAACEHEYTQRPIKAEEITPGVPFSWKCFQVAAGEGGEGEKSKSSEESGGGRTATTTSVACNYVFATFTDTCTATVTGSPTPTGQVAFNSAAGGVFTLGSTCNLTPAGSGVSSCSVQFQPASTSLAAVTSTQITASYAGDAANQPSSGNTVFGSAALIQRQETAVREGCAAAQGSTGVITTEGVAVTLNVVVPGTVEGNVVASSTGGSTLPVSLPRLRPLSAVTAAQGVGCEGALACCGGSTGTLPVSLPPLHPIAATTAARQGKAKPRSKSKPRLVATLKAHLAKGGPTKLVIPYTAYGRKVEKAFAKQLRAYRHRHKRGARKPVLRLRLTLVYTPG
jgi:hypothetical protein